MRHVGKVLGILGTVGAGTAVVAHAVRKRAHRADAERSVDEAFAALPRLDLHGGLAQFKREASNDNLADVDRRMAHRAHAHVVNDAFDEKNADPFSDAYSVYAEDDSFYDEVPVYASKLVEMYEDDDIMVIDDSMIVEYEEVMTPAGSMFVGAVDEVELGGPMRNDDPLAYDPEEVPSEHSEINELRQKMPFG